MGTMKVKGDYIRIYREGKGLTVAEFADVCGVTRQAVEAWERGEVAKFSTLEKIANRLGVKEAALVDM